MFQWTAIHHFLLVTRLIKGMVDLEPNWRDWKQKSRVTEGKITLNLWSKSRGNRFWCEFNSEVGSFEYFWESTVVLKAPTRKTAVTQIQKLLSCDQGGVMNSSIAPIGIARRTILAIVTSREIYPRNFKWIQRAKLFRGFKRAFRQRLNMLLSQYIYCNILSH